MTETTAHRPRRLPRARTLTALAALLLVPAVYGSVALREAEQAHLDRAHEQHAAAVDEATQAYRQALEQANDQLRQNYASLITRYERDGQDETAAALNEQLQSRLAELPAVTSADAAHGLDIAANWHAAMIESLGPNLVNAQREPVPTEAIHTQPYVMLYFSAAWCGPCQRFNPQLKAFYEEHRDTDLFEVVLVSRDRSNADMLRYLHNVEMPWLAIPFNRINDSGVLQNYGGRGIPNLVLIDSNGEVVSGSYRDGRYVGPRTVLNDMKQIIDHHAEHGSLPEDT